jgi:hypothetical protein
VPQFYVLDENSASATLYDDGTITLAWPNVELMDSLVGLSPGAWLGSYTATDFSDDAGTGAGTPGGALFEQFLPATRPFDLNALELTFFRRPDGSYRWIR